jgi:hypothetical protein
MKIYIAFKDGRENEADPILGVFKKEEDAYIRVGKYHRQENTDRELASTVPNHKELSDLELGRDVFLNQFSCIIGHVEEYELIQKIQNTNERYL